MNDKPILPQTPAQIAKLLALPHWKYVQTPYWKAVAAWCRATVNYCEEPGCAVPSSRCEVHHDLAKNAYAYKGREPRRVLKVLCPKHHGKQHPGKSRAKRTLIKGIGKMVRTII